MSTRRSGAAVPLVLMLAACVQEQQPPLAASDITAYAALPGQPAGVAYFSLENSTTSAITLRQVTSPEFGNVEMHTTLVDDGIARMMPLDSLTIAEHSKIEFVPGGAHLMLMEPIDGLGVGDVVTLELHFDSGEVHVADNEPRADDDHFLALRAPLQSR